MSYVNRVVKTSRDTTFEDEDWAELVSPTQRGALICDPKATKDHRNLTHRDAPAQHPMSAIEGLIDALAEKVSKDSISAERTSEGTVITIGDTSIIIYDNNGNINSISINGRYLPVDMFGNVDIDTSDLDLSNSYITIENEESTTTTTIANMVEVILNQINELRAEIPEIVFRIWPGVQEG